MYSNTCAACYLQLDGRSYNETTVSEIQLNNWIWYGNTITRTQKVLKWLL